MNERKEKKRNSFRNFLHWVLCENSFKQLLMTHPIVITNKGTNWSWKFWEGLTKNEFANCDVRSNHSRKYLGNQFSQIFFWHFHYLKQIIFSKKTKKIAYVHQNVSNSEGAIHWKFSFGEGAKKRILVSIIVWWKNWFLPLFTTKLNPTVRTPVEKDLQLWFLQAALCLHPSYQYVYRTWSVWKTFADSPPYFDFSSIQEKVKKIWAK